MLGKNSPGKNTGVGCCALLQAIFPTQRSNPHFLYLSPALASRFFTTSTTYSLRSVAPNKQIFWVCVFWFKRIHCFHATCNLARTGIQPLHSTSVLKVHFLMDNGSGKHDKYSIYHLAFSIVLTEWFPLFYLSDHLFILLHYSFCYLLSLDQLSSWQMNFFFAPLYSF